MIFGTDSVISNHNIIAKFDVAADRLTYQTTMLRLLPFLMLDDRSPPTLQTAVVVSFVRAQGLPILFTTLDTIWKETLDSPVEVKTKMYGAIEVILSVLQTMTSSKLLHDSPHTSTLTSKHNRDRGAEFFEPHEFLVETRLTVLSKIREQPWARTEQVSCGPGSTWARHTIGCASSTSRDA